MVPLSMKLYDLKSVAVRTRIVLSRSRRVYTPPQGRAAYLAAMPGSSDNKPRDCIFLCLAFLHTPPLRIGNSCDPSVSTLTVFSS